MKISQYRELEKTIARWEEAVSWIEKGWDCEDEYREDVSARHRIYQLMRIRNECLSDALQIRLDAADSHYRAATVDDWPFSSSNCAVDRELNWYWFRRPAEASMRKAWENNPEFRCSIKAAIPDIRGLDDGN